MAVPTSVRARLQINILIEPDVDIEYDTNFYLFLGMQLVITVI